MLKEMQHGNFGSGSSQLTPEFLYVVWWQQNGDFGPIELKSRASSFEKGFYKAGSPMGD